MPDDSPKAADSPEPSNVPEAAGASITQIRLRPLSDRILSRVATLSKVDGLSEEILNNLNSWYQNEWRCVHAARFSMCPSIGESLHRYFMTRQSPHITSEHVESYLSTSSILYYGLRGDSTPAHDVSKNRYFQRYYYTARENAIALNSFVVMSNFIWACHYYMRDEFANTCLLDILLQAFPAALDNFIRLRGVVYLRSTLDYLALNGKIRSSTNYLLKALALLNKLDISFPVLQSSRIGIPINGIATGGKNAKLGLDYECESDQVKLKATDLIKKWKAIRDASQPARVDADPRRQLRKQPSSEQSAQPHSDDKSPVPAARRAAQPPGSFVLNILDSMVEQREKEKKRKIAMKEAQRNSLFKVSRAQEGEDGNAPSRVAAETPVQAVPLKVATDSKPAAEGDQAGESRKELQSLMNFFKSFKPQVNAAEAGSTMPPRSTQPPIRISGDKTGLTISSNNFTHTNVVPAPSMTTNTATPSLVGQTSEPEVPKSRNGVSGSGDNIPPWK
ncbi:TFIIS helical bundle-like domain family protein [Babesia bovis T2Bo]|uniref:TFIIS N-terminal domain-containing protein n=1 Tax=Babesia bovis TaxID=5865 RepID=A7AQX8_BABBO|nr:TFIIS helical bundle-like domain family protein [Babesia bovis T2Bo]EDO06947.1 TFIIS helical bundle-like domain family protein [Babesia bovis T2Bo]|eukprot:XP_001610515.1 hypothetical protein [Babesia bovis T2Bo]